MSFWRSFRPNLAATALLGAFACAACNSDPPLDPLLPVGSIAITSLDWSSTPAQLGNVAAVAESGDDLAIYSDNGVYVYNSGASIGSDNSVQSWRAAAVVPALGFTGQWLLGVDGEGRLYRLRNQTVLEEVTDLYGLGDRRAQAVMPLGGALVAFAIDQALAVSDGQNLNDYGLPLRGFSGGSGRVATVGDGEVQIFDVPSGTLSHRPADGVFTTAFTADGQLWAATAEALLREVDGSLQKVFAPEAGHFITGLIASGGSLWLSINDSLAVVRDNQLLRGDPGSLPAGAKLWGSPTGDVWSDSGDTLQRLGDAAGVGADAVYWRQNLWPIFERLCQACHLPAGSAHIDLSTYSAWASRRALIEQRVVQGQPSPMPPTGNGTLTPDELAAVSTWAARPASP